MNITERSSDFVNPYRKKTIVYQVNKEEKNRGKKKKKKETHRGPKLTLPKIGEL